MSLNYALDPELLLFRASGTLAISCSCYYQCFGTKLNETNHKVIEFDGVMPIK